MPSLDNADQAAQAAAQSLDEGDLSEAEQQEQEVEKALEEALSDLEEEEETYQRLRQEEVLFRIAEEITAMLESHRKQMADIAEVHGMRQKDRAPSRAQRLRLRRIARDESALAARADEIAVEIAKEGAEVSAELMRIARSDMERIAESIGAAGDYTTGERAQAIGRKVENALIWLLEALRDEQQRRQSEDQQQQQQQDGQDEQQPPEGPPPLIPDSAEVKLLRRMELDIQSAVEELLRLYPELGEDASEIDPLLLDEIARLATRHERVTELFSGMRERLGLPAPEEPNE
jgi:hypothetical protein